jgi:hypothetical protein
VWADAGDEASVRSALESLRRQAVASAPRTSEAAA